MMSHSGSVSSGEHAPVNSITETGILADSFYFIIPKITGTQLKLYWTHKKDS